MRSVRLVLCMSIALALCLSPLFIAPAGAWTAVFTHYATPTASSYPVGICAGPDGNVWFAESSADRVGKVTTAGAITEYPLAAGSGPNGICAGPDGALWVTELDADKIGRVTTAGTVTNEYALAAGSAPTGICAGPDGALWFTNQLTDKIGRVTTAGVVTEYALVTGSRPTGICAGPDGALWFTNQFTDKIGRITTAGAITEYALPSLSNPYDIALGPDGAMWFTESIASKIGRITTTGAITEYATPTAAASPYGICHGPGGVMWVVEFNTKSFARVRMNGTMTEHLICGGAGDPPNMVCTGPDGNLWWTEFGATSYVGKGVTDSPYIFDITPNEGQRGTTVNIADIAGNNYGVGGAPTVKLIREGQADIAATNVNMVSGTKITCDFAIPGNAAAGAWNVVVANGDGQSDTLYGGFEVTTPPVAGICYMAEGCTAGDFETWVLAQNPDTSAITVDLTLMTEAGPQVLPDLQGVTIPAQSRVSFNIGAYVQTFNVSTQVTCYGNWAVCERAMYGNNRAWGTDSVASYVGSTTWFLAEGCTAGDFETWVLVQNPNPTAATVDLTFMTSSGEQPGPQGVNIPAYSRQSFNAGASVVDYNVSTRVTADQPVVAERAMYGNGRTWAHDSIGAFLAANTWYLAEGCTAGGFETWVLVQNPNPTAATVDLTLMTDTGPQNPPPLQNVEIPANSRQSFNLGLYSVNYNVSTQVDADIPVICERAVYGSDRTWGTDSIGSYYLTDEWFLAEGCTAGDFETWVLVQNPTAAAVTVDLTFMTSTGPQAGPQNVSIPAYSRKSFNVADWVVDWNVSTEVYSTGGPVVCERAMYGNGRQWAHDSIGLGD